MNLAPVLDPGEVFRDLCAVPSPSLAERRAGELVTQLLDGLAIDWARDGAGERIGGDEDNIHAVIPSASGGTGGGILLAAHLDTVPPGRTLAPTLEAGIWVNAGDGILGADNKAAVTSLLCAAANWAVNRPAVPVELLFTVAEEIGLLGAASFPMERTAARAAFVFDHPSPIGTVVAVSPGHTRIEATITGREAHSGIRPEDGANAIVAASRAICAIQLGRLGEATTANVGRISGGSAGNVVPGECRFEAEVRSPSPEESAALVLALTDSIQAAADSEGCAADLVVSTSFVGYAHGEAHPALGIGRRALESVGIEPSNVSSGGGSDANVFEAGGLPSLNLGDGSLATHTADERIADEDLRKLVEVVLALPGSA